MRLIPILILLALLSGCADARCLRDAGSDHPVAGC